MVTGAAEAAVPPPRDARLTAGRSACRDGALAARINPRVNHPADPLPYGSASDWADRAPIDHLDDAHDPALAQVATRGAARVNLRLGRERDALDAR